MLREGDGTVRRNAGFLPNTSTCLWTNDAGSAGTVGLFRASLDAAADVRLDDQAWLSGIVVDARTVLLKRGTAVYEQPLAPGAERTAGPARLISAEVPRGPEAWTASPNGVLAS